MATIQEVARLAGVSAGSVSRYLNGHKLKERNARAVERAIAELGYHRNYLARGLRAQRSLSVGLLVNNMLNDFAMRVVARVEREMELRDYTILLAGFRDDPALFEGKLRLLLDRRVDGVIVFEGDATWAESRLLEEAGVPVIALAAPYASPRVDSIVASSREGVAQVVGRMIELGHERVGIIAAERDEYVGRERLAGALEAFDRAGLPRSRARVLAGGFSPERGYRDMARLLDDEGVDAVFCCNYGTGTGALRLIAERGLKPGGDVSYAGYDYLGGRMGLYPRVTSLCPPAEAMGELAARRLLEMIEAGEMGSGNLTALPDTIRWEPSIADLRA